MMALGEPWPWPYTYGQVIPPLPPRFVPWWDEGEDDSGKDLEVILIMVRECDKLKAENERLQAENAELKARLGDKT